MHPYKPWRWYHTVGLIMIIVLPGVVLNIQGSSMIQHVNYVRENSIYYCSPYSPGSAGWDECVAYEEGVRDKAMAEGTGMVVGAILLYSLATFLVILSIVRLRKPKDTQFGS